MITRRTHLFAWTLFILGAVSSPPTSAAYALGSLVGMYVFVIICQQIVRGGRIFWAEASGRLNRKREQ